MKAADAIVEVLKREGVKTLFCFPTTSIIENAVAAGIRPIICRQERVGVDMADGFARVVDEPGASEGVVLEERPQASAHRLLIERDVIERVVRANEGQDEVEVVATRTVRKTSVAV